MTYGRYTVNEVEERTKVPASTLRQWERRYGFPKPDRSDAGYRLYSDADIAHIESMKRHIANGVPASRAAQLVQRRPEAAAAPRSAAALRRELVQALEDLDDARADAVLSEAHALHSVESVMLSVMRDAMVEIGDRWHAGTVDATTEHFASNYIEGKLRGLLAYAGSNPHGAAVVVACAPLEQHELGALMLTVFLRRLGYHVFFLGANTPVDDLFELCVRLRPIAVMISASMPDAVQRLVDKRSYLDNLAPVVVYGGMAFNVQPQLAARLGGHYLSPELGSSLDEFQDLVRERELVPT